MSFFIARIRQPGADVLQKKGWRAAWKWLLLRRATQVGIFALFLLSPVLGVWVIKGNLAASLLFDFLPMSDPFIFLQSLASGHWPYLSAWIGLGITLAFYLLVGGRSYCAWVCPLNMVTDSAAWLRRRIGWKIGRTPARSFRLWLLGMLLIACTLSGSMVWEWVNPVSALQRSIIFGGALGYLMAFGIFLYELILAPRGWCGHLCPMGACYKLINSAAVLRVAAPARAACNDCMDCFAVCPEPHVIRPALKGSGSPLILSSDCTNCGRCIDVCSESVFRMTHRFKK